MPFDANGFYVKDEDDDFERPTTPDIEGTVKNHVQDYLSGRTELQALFDRVRGIYEDYASPSAESVMMLLYGYAAGGKHPHGLKRSLEEVVYNMSTFH